MSEPNERDIEVGRDINSSCLADGIWSERYMGYAVLAVAEYRDEVEAAARADERTKVVAEFKAAWGPQPDDYLGRKLREMADKIAGGGT